MSPPKIPENPHADRGKVPINTEDRMAGGSGNITPALASSLDLTTVLNLILDRIAPLLTYGAATTVCVFKPGAGKRPDLAASRNLGGADRQAKDWIGAHGIWEFQENAPLVIDDFRTDPRIEDPAFFLDQGLISCLGIPLTVDHANVGVLSVYAKEKHIFSEEEVGCLSTIAGEAAIAIRNAVLYEETRSHAAELERRNKMKSEFLSMMSHELTTPLTAIMGYAEMIENGTYGQINAEQQSALQRIAGHSTDLLNLFNAILAATKIESKSLPVDSNEVSVKNLLDELKSTYETRPIKEVKLIWDYPAEFPPVRTDGGKLTHILQNLINNAVKFTDRGQVTISARSLLSSKSAEFTVSDTGIGIPPEEITSIFDMFRRVDSPDGRDYSGVGMGLYIVRRFTELLGGSVDVTSVPGEGSTFTVTIPWELDEKQLPADAAQLSERKNDSGSTSDI